MSPDLAAATCMWSFVAGYLIGAALARRASRPAPTVDGFDRYDDVPGLVDWPAMERDVTS